MITFCIQQLARLFDLIDSHAVRVWMERWIVYFATGGFILHLLLLAMIHFVPAMKVGVLERLEGNFLQAVYTPFSFILFYEVIWNLPEYRRG